MSQETVLRYQWESYMNCGTVETPDYNLIGEGFTSFPESKNPKEYTRKYINYQTEKTDVIGYSPSISYSCDTITDEPVVQEIINITDNELVGSDTHRDIVSVNLWEEFGSYAKATGSYDANETYYTKSGDVYELVASSSSSGFSSYYVKTVSGYKAYKRTYAIIPDGKGDGTDALIYTGTMKAASDIVKGTFDRTTKTFTADT